MSEFIVQKTSTARNTASGWVSCCDVSRIVVLCVASDLGVIRQGDFEVSVTGWKLTGQNKIQVEIDPCFESTLKTGCLVTISLYIDRRSGFGYHNLHCRVGVKLTYAILTKVKTKQGYTP